MLEEAGIRIETQRSTTKEPLGDDDVRLLLARADRVVIARGRGQRELAPDEADLDDLRGPSGGYRAPMLLSGGTLLVGFSSAALEALREAAETR